VMGLEAQDGSSAVGRHRSWGKPRTAGQPAATDVAPPYWIIS
jgi:hypothetical protein